MSPKLKNNLKNHLEQQNVSNITNNRYTNSTIEDDFQVVDMGDTLESSLAEQSQQQSSHANNPSSSNSQYNRETYRSSQAQRTAVYQLTGRLSRVINSALSTIGYGKEANPTERERIALVGMDTEAYEQALLTTPIEPVSANAPSNIQQNNINISSNQIVVADTKSLSDTGLEQRGFSSSEGFVQPALTATYAREAFTGTRDIMLEEMAKRDPAYYFSLQAISNQQKNLLEYQERTHKMTLDQDKQNLQILVGFMQKGISDLCHGASSLKDNLKEDNSSAQQSITGLKEEIAKQAKTTEESIRGLKEEFAKQTTSTGQLMRDLKQWTTEQAKTAEESIKSLKKESIEQMKNTEKIVENLKGENTKQASLTEGSIQSLKEEITKQAKNTGKFITNLEKKSTVQIKDAERSVQSLKEETTKQGKITEESIRDLKEETAKQAKITEESIKKDLIEEIAKHTGNAKQSISEQLSNYDASLRALTSKERRQRLDWQKEREEEILKTIKKEITKQQKFILASQAEKSDEKSTTHQINLEDIRELSDSQAKKFDQRLDEIDQKIAKQEADINAIRQSIIDNIEEAAQATACSREFQAELKQNMELVVSTLQEIKNSKKRPNSIDKLTKVCSSMKLVKESLISVSSLLQPLKAAKTR